MQNHIRHETLITTITPTRMKLLGLLLHIGIQSQSSSTTTISEAFGIPVICFGFLNTTQQQ